MRLLPSALRSRLESALQTSANNADPRMEIFLGRTSDIITVTERFLVRTVRSGASLGALALAAERPDPTKGPTRLWMIYIAAGVARVATAPLPFGAGPQWTDLYTLGPTTHVAIEFDGIWDDVENSTYIYTNPPKSRFVHYTRGLPWFFRAAAGDLVAQQGQSGTPVTLATGGVSGVTAKRGWKSVVIPSHDQGLIVAYLRSGSVYYRNLAEREDGSVIWESEQAVSELPTGVSSLSLFRTSDYRTGFLVEAAGQVHLAVTSRAWAGMALGPEQLSAAIRDLNLTVHPVAYRTALAPAERLAAGITGLWLNVAQPISPVLQSADYDDQYTVRLQLSHPAVESLAGLQTAFTVRDDNGITFAVQSTAAGVGQSEIVLTVANFSTAIRPVTVSYDPAAKQLTALNQGSAFAFAASSAQFQPVFEPPKAYADEWLSAAVTGMSLVVTQVSYRNRYTSEQLTAAVTSVSIVVTKVGSNPL